MLSAEENELLTRIGPGTKMGGLLRRYWQPVAGAAEMEDRWTLCVRILGEDLVLFKTRKGDFGLIAEQCDFGVPVDNALLMRDIDHEWHSRESLCCTSV